MNRLVALSDQPIVGLVPLAWDSPNTAGYYAEVVSEDYKLQQLARKHINGINVSHLGNELIVQASGCELDVRYPKERPIIATAPPPSADLVNRLPYPYAARKSVVDI